MAVSSYTLGDADVNREFKIKYGPKSEKKWQLSNPVTNLVKQVYDFTGEYMEVPNPLSSNASASTNIIPLYNRPKVERLRLERKKAYATTEIDRMTLKAASSVDSYIDGNLKGHAQGAVEAFSNNYERMWAGDGSGKLGTIKSSAGTSGVGAGVWDIVISDTTWVQANWEPYDIVNIGTGSTTYFTVEAVTPSTKTIRVARFSGSDSPADSAAVFKQNAENADFYGFAWATDNSGLKYNLATQYRYQAVRTDAASQAISADLLDAHATEFSINRGKFPTHIFVSYKQYGRLKMTHENLKQYVIPRNGDMTARLGWKAVELQTADGEVAIMPWRFCPEDRAYSVYMPDLSSHHTPGGPQWIDEDGSVWNRAERPKDAFYANYATYGQNKIPPSSVGVIHTLALVA